MTWPLDVFEASYADAVEFFNAEHGASNKKQKLKEKAAEMKERTKARLGGSVGWWVK